MCWHLAASLYALCLFASGFGTALAASDRALDRFAAQIAEFEKQNGDLGQQEAVSALQDIIRQLASRPDGAPLQARAWRRLGEIHQLRRDHKSAAAAFEQSVKYDPAQPTVQYRLGMEYRQLGSERKAAGALSSAVDGGFRNVGALFNLVEACFASRQLALGLQRSRELRDLGGESPDLMLRLGRLLFNSLYYDDALKVFELAVRAAPDAYEPLFYLALTHHLANEPRKAVELLRLLAEYSPNGELLALLGSAEAQKGDYDAAERTLRYGMAKYPDSPHPVLNLALIELQRDRLDAATELLQKLRAMSTASSAKVFFRVSRNSCEQIHDEIIAAPKTTETPPDAPEYFEQLADQMLSRYHYWAALELIRLAARNGGHSPTLLKAAGLCCFNLEPHSDTAVRMIESAVAADPNLAEAWHLLGRAHTRQGRYEKAIACLRRAVEIRPKALYYLSLGRAYMASDSGRERGEIEQARGAFERALQLAPDDAAIFYELGRLYAQRHQNELAKKYLQRAADIEPDFYEAYYALGRVCSRLGLSDEARQYLARFEKFRQATREQTVLKSGYLNEGREP